MIDWPFAGLEPGAYRVVSIDPPWRMSLGTKGRPQHYQRMTDAELIELGPAIRALAHPDGCAYFVWMCSPMFERSFRVVKAWRLRYSARAFVWLKTRGVDTPLFIRPDGLHLGHGYTTRKNAEDCFLYKVGRPRRIARDVREPIFSPLREHSRKPDESFDRIERLFAGPRAELFARQSRKNWATWGNELTKFDQADLEV